MALIDNVGVLICVSLGSLNCHRLSNSIPNGRPLIDASGGTRLKVLTKQL